MKQFQVKYLEDGRAMLNVACGTKMNWEWNNVDFSPYATLRRSPRLARIMKKLGLLSDLRWNRLQGVDPTIIRWDLRRGIPFADETFDCVYHSHFLEHIDRSAVPTLLRECGRVLKRGGVLRIVVPDLHTLVQKYQATFEAAETSGDIANIQAHLDMISAMFDQIVRQKGAGATQQSRLLGDIEARLRGGAASIGEQHRWMYDRISLTHALNDVGFREILVCDPNTSRVEGWSEFQLDVDATGKVHKRNSLYVEARK